MNWAREFYDKQNAWSGVYEGDVAATIEKLLSMGAKAYEAPTERGQGFITASVVDPFGNILGIMYNPHYLEILSSTKKSVTRATGYAR